MFLELTAYFKSFISCDTQCIRCWRTIPIFVGFEEREKLMNFIERVSGARLTCIIYTAGERSFRFTYEFIKMIFIRLLNNLVNGSMKIEELLSNQSHLRQRLNKYRKSFSFEDALNLGFNWRYVTWIRDAVMPHVRRLSLMKFTIN